MQRSRCINGKPPPAAIFPSHVRPTSTHIFVLVTGIYYLVLIDSFYIFCQSLYGCITLSQDLKTKANKGVLDICYVVGLLSKSSSISSYCPLRLILTHNLVPYLGNEIYQDVIPCQLVRCIYIVTPTDVLLLPISNQIEEKKQNAKAETWILV